MPRLADRPNRRHKSLGRGAANEPDRRPQIARAAAAKRDLGKLSRLDSRRLRLLPHGLHAEGDRRGVRDRHRSGIGRHLLDAGGTTDRSFRVRLARRAFRPPPRADGGHHSFLRVRACVGLRAIADDPAHPPLPVRDRDGRRVGPGRQPRHGEHSCEAARSRLGLAPERLSVGLFRRQPRLFPAVRHDRLARHVHGRRRPRPARAAHPNPREGKPGVRRPARQGRGEADRRAVPPLEDRALHDRADGRLQRVQPRHAGPLPDLPSAAASLRHAHSPAHSPQS